MFVPPKLQAEFEVNLIWKRFWPHCLLALIASVEVLLGAIIFFTEVLNLLMDFRHANVFGGFWASLILFINWILIFVTVCCATTTRASTCALIWHMITIGAFSVLIGFDAAFIMNPHSCILTGKCVKINSILPLHSITKNSGQLSQYTAFDSKRYFLSIQFVCACIVLLLSILYVAIFVVCRLRLRQFITKLRSKGSMQL